jgi:hypothetical protein
MKCTICKLANFFAVLRKYIFYFWGCEFFFTFLIYFVHFVHKRINS